MNTLTLPKIPSIALDSEALELKIGQFFQKFAKSPSTENGMVFKSILRNFLVENWTTPQLLTEMRSRCGIDAEKEFLSLLVDLVAANDLANLCALSSMKPKSCVTVRQSEVAEEEDDDEDYGTTPTTDDTFSDEETSSKKERGKKRSYDYDCKPSRTRNLQSKWTPEEDEKLLNLMRTLPDDVPNRWNVIASKIQNKTHSQCFQHWHRVINPDINKGSWSAREEASLIKLVNEFNTAWASIASGLPRRTDIQCRYQWKRLQKSKARLWSTEEVKVLIELVKNSQTDQNTDAFWIHVASEHTKKCNKMKENRNAPRGALDCQEKWKSLEKQL